MRERTIWIAAGLLGLAVAVGLAVLTSLVSQPPVGVPGEPVSAGKTLAPARTVTASGAGPDRGATRITTTRVPSRSPLAAAQRHNDDDSDSSGSSSRIEGDEDSGRGRGRGRGRGGDD